MLNHYKKNRTIACLALTIILVVNTTGCKKAITVDPPVNSLVTTSVFANDATAIAAQLSVYTNMASFNFNDGIVLTGMSSDELTNYSMGQGNIDYYVNNLSAVVEGNSVVWSQLYNYIYQENAILENVAVSTGMSDRVKKLATGEAYFMRAFCYFQLVNYYGDVPLILSTDYKANSILARTPTTQIYQQMVSDLQNAQGLLSSSYIDGSDNVLATPDKVRPTTWAATALLARAYLYMGGHDAQAIQQANSIISNTSYTLSPLSGSNNVFTKNSSEAIWQLLPGNSANTPEGAQFILTTAPGSSGTSVSISPQLLGAFEAGDARKVNWIGSIISGGTTYYFPYKYKVKSASTVTEYSMILRLAELYLIRAEAEANTNDFTDAVNDLNVIRTRASLPNYVFTNQTALQTAIQHERQVELFTENHRWFDLKRTKTVDAVMSVVTQQKGGVWQSYQQLYPLNPTDLSLNPNLVQNTGY